MRVVNLPNWWHSPQAAAAQLRLWAEARRAHSQFASAWSSASTSPSTKSAVAIPLSGPSPARQEFTAIAKFFRTYEWQFWFVLALSAAIMLVLQASVTFWYYGSDHADYLNYGYYLLGELPPYALPQWRTPGMGIFHILSGTLLLDTWWGFRALCALLGIAMPLLVYLMVRRFSHAFAFVAALVTILSMTPYVYAFQPLSDHVFYFFHLLVLLLCVSYFVRRTDSSYKLPVAIALASAYLNLVRPVGAIIFWIFIAVALVSRPRDWRRLAAACGVYLAIMAAWVIWDRDYGANLGAMPGNFFPLPAGFTTKAERRLAEAYYAPRGLAPAMSDEAAEGHPRSKDLRELMRRYLAEHPEKWQEPAYFTPPSLFAAFAGTPDKLLDALFADRNSLYFGFIVRSAQDALGKDSGLALLHDVAAEHGATGLSGLASAFLRDPTRLFLGVLPKFSARMMVSTFYIAPHSEIVITGFPERMLTADLGPASARVLEIMRTFIYDYPQYCEERKIFKKCPDDYYQAIVSEGRVDGKLDSALMWQAEADTWSVLTWYLGLEPSQRIYGQVAGEIIKRYPRIVFLFYDNFLRKTVLKLYGIIGVPTIDELIHRSDALPLVEKQNTAHLRPGLANELAPTLSRSWPWTTALVLHAIGFLAAPLFILALIVALPFYRGPATAAACGFLLLVYLQEVTSLSLLSPVPLPRYEGAFYLLPFLIACIIFGSAHSRWLRNNTRGVQNK